MSDEQHRVLSPFARGWRRVLAEKEIAEGRLISAAQLAREASGIAGGPVQPTAPGGLMLDRPVADTDKARLLRCVGLAAEQVEGIGQLDLSVESMLALARDASE